MPVYYSEDEVAKVAKTLGECAGPTGVDGIMLRGWVLQKGLPSQKFREEIANWVILLNNESPTYATYRALNSSSILPAEKTPGVRPLAGGESLMRLISACNIVQTGNQATVACGNTQLCANTHAGIEGNLHAVRAIWPQSSGWTIDDDGSFVEDKLYSQPEEKEPPDPNAGTSKAAHDPTIDRGADPDATRSRFKEDVGYGQALFDAKNAFNLANRYLMLWNVHHRWNKASRFAFNRYKHHNICYLRDDPGKPAYVILSKEGTT